MSMLNLTGGVYSAVLHRRIEIVTGEDVTKVRLYHTTTRGLSVAPARQYDLKALPHMVCWVAVTSVVSVPLYPVMCTILNPKEGL